MINVKLLIMGMLTMGFLVPGLFFLKFWRRTHDLLFLAFALAFLIFAAERAITAIWVDLSTPTQELYLLRLAGFLLILVAIIGKNLTLRTPTGYESPVSRAGTTATGQDRG